MSRLLVTVLNRIADDVVDDAPHLLGVSNDSDLAAECRRIGKEKPLRLGLEPQVFGAIRKELGRRQNRKVIGNAIRIDFGIKGEFVDQMIHLVCLVIDGADIAVHLRGTARDAVLNSLHIALNRGDRGL